MKNNICDDLRTVDYKLYADYKNGNITLHDAAREFCRCGWTNFVDEEYTVSIFNRIEQEKINKNSTSIS
jgi:hypothetical protein